MPAIIRTGIASNNFRYLKGGYPVPASEPSGFDSATGRVLFHGSMSQLYAKFPVGGPNVGSSNGALPDAPSGSTFYCLGPQGQPVQEFGHIWADIGWKGIISRPKLPSQDSNLITGLGEGNYLLSVSQQMSTNETLWPQTRDGLTVFAGNPYAPSPGYRNLGVISPSGAAFVTAIVPYRVRIIGRAYTVSIRGMTVGKRAVINRPPLCKLPNPHYVNGVGSPLLPDANFPDPLYTYNDDTDAADGWVCRNYQRNGGEYPMGEKILAFWTADYEWVFRRNF